MNSDQPGYVPTGFVPLLTAIARRAGRRDPATLERARSAMLQEFGDGEMRVVVLSETTGSLIEVEARFWRTGGGERAIRTGRVELLPGSPALPITLRLLHFVAGPCFVRSEDVDARAPGKRATSHKATPGKAVSDDTIRAFILARRWTDRTRPSRDKVERLVCEELGCKRDQVRRIVAEMEGAGKRAKGRPSRRKKPARVRGRGEKTGRSS